MIETTLLVLMLSAVLTSKITASGARDWQLARQGQMPPRYAERIEALKAAAALAQDDRIPPAEAIRVIRRSGAFGDYVSALVNDVWAAMHRNHEEAVARRAESRQRIAAGLADPTPFQLLVEKLFARGFQAWDRAWADLDHRLEARWGTGKRQEADVTADGDDPSVQDRKPTEDTGPGTDTGGPATDTEEPPTSDPEPEQSGLPPTEPGGEEDPPVETKAASGTWEEARQAHLDAYGDPAAAAAYADGYEAVYANTPVEDRPVHAHVMHAWTRKREQLDTQTTRTEEGRNMNARINQAAAPARPASAVGTGPKVPVGDITSQHGLARFTEAMARSLMQAAGQIELALAAMAGAGMTDTRALTDAREQITAAADKLRGKAHKVQTAANQVGEAFAAHTGNVGETRRWITGGK